MTKNLQVLSDEHEDMNKVVEELENFGDDVRRRFWEFLYSLKMIYKKYRISYDE